VVRAQNLNMSEAYLNAEVEDQNGLGIDIGVREKMVMKAGFGVSSSTYGLGNAGNIDIRTDTLQMFSATGIDSSAFYGLGGNAGNISIQARSILIDGRLEPAVGPGPTGISVSTGSAGAGGSVTIATDSLELKSGAYIDATTKPDIFSYNEVGRAGNIDITANKIIHLTDGSSISTRSESEAPGGKIRIASGSLALDQSSTIESASTSSGTSGSISVETTGPIILSGQSQISTEASAGSANGISIQSRGNILLDHSQITARAAQDGGNISVNSPSLIYLRNGSITAEAGGNGGNITIDPLFVLLGDSKVLANAISGNGGNITIDTGYLVASPASLVSASSEFGLSGQISILGPSVNLAGSLVKLPGGLRGTESELPERCAVRLSGDSSSFTSLGRGGLPLEPADAVPSLLSFDQKQETK
jgi:large exoprotein involved in heme utilization and adhesion